MRRQLVPGPVVRLTVIKAKTRPGIEAAGKANWGTGHNNRSTYIIMEEQWMMLNASYRAAQLLYEYIGTGLQYMSKVQVHLHGQSTDSHALLPK